jgi:hypothetical protein
VGSFKFITPHPPDTKYLSNFTPLELLMQQALLDALMSIPKLPLSLRSVVVTNSEGSSRWVYVRPGHFINQTLSETTQTNER